MTMKVTVRSTTEGESVRYRIEGTGTAAPAAPDDTTTTPTEHDIVLSGGSPDELLHYEFHVDGNVEPGDRANLTNEDAVDDGHVKGGVAGGRDNYRYVGDIVDFEAEDGVDVRIDGEVVDTADLASDTHHISVTGGTKSDPVNYELTVMGSVERGERANISAEDDVSGEAATGHVIGGTDDYYYRGVIADFQADGDLEIAIDGESVSPETIGVDEQGVTHVDGTFTIEDTTDGVAEYVVDGDVEDFEQLDGGSDWVLEFDGEPVHFGGPESPVNGEFAYATKTQIRSFVECYVDKRLEQAGLTGDN